MAGPPFGNPFRRRPNMIFVRKGPSDVADTLKKAVEKAFSGEDFDLYSLYEAYEVISRTYDKFMTFLPKPDDVGATVFRRRTRQLIFSLIIRHNSRCEYEQRLDEARSFISRQLARAVERWAVRRPWNWLSVENFLKLVIANYLYYCRVRKAFLSPVSYDERDDLVHLAAQYLVYRIGCPVDVSDYVSRLPSTKKLPREKVYVCPVCGLLRTSKRMYEHMLNHWPELLEVLKQDGVVEYLLRVEAITIAGEFDRYASYFGRESAIPDIEKHLLRVVSEGRRLLYEHLCPYLERLGLIDSCEASGGGSKEDRGGDGRRGSEEGSLPPLIPEDEELD